jgi:transposase
MKAYSLDLRQRIIDALQAGKSRQEVANQFQVSLSTVKRYKREFHLNQTLAPKPRPGKRPFIGKEEYPELLALVKTRTDWTLATLSQEWKQLKGVHASVSVLSDTCRRAGITFKKRVATPKRETPKNAKSS